MPTFLLSFKRNTDSSLLVHGTLTPNETQSEKEMEAHARICPKFGPARKNGDTIEMAIDVDSIPDFDEVSIGAWLDEEFGIGDEDEEDEEDAEEEDEEEDEEEATPDR